MRAFRFCRDRWRSPPKPAKGTGTASWKEILPRRSCPTNAISDAWGGGSSSATTVDTDSRTPLPCRPRSGGPLSGLGSSSDLSRAYSAMRTRYEADLSAESNSPQARAWIPGSDEDPFRASDPEPTSSEGAQTIGGFDTVEVTRDAAGRPLPADGPDPSLQGVPEDHTAWPAHRVERFRSVRSAQGKRPRGRRTATRHHGESQGGKRGGSQSNQTSCERMVSHDPGRSGPRQRCGRHRSSGGGGAREQRALVAAR